MKNKERNEKVEKGFPKDPDNITGKELKEHFDLNKDGNVTIEEYSDHINFHCKNPDVLEDELEQADYERGFKYEKGGKLDEAQELLEEQAKGFGFDYEGWSDEKILEWYDRHDYYDNLNLGYGIHYDSKGDIDVILQEGDIPYETKGGEVDAEVIMEGRIKKEIPPEQWGAGVWRWLHKKSFEYPDNPTQRDKTEYAYYYNNLPNVLPCKECRENIATNLKKFPLTDSDLNNSHTLSLWVYKVHEIVNKMLKKESGLSYNDVKNHYVNGSTYAKGGQVYRHKHIPTMTFEITGETSKGYQGIQKDKKSLSKLERIKGKKVSYSSSELKELFEKDYAKGGDVPDEMLIKDWEDWVEKSYGNDAIVDMVEHWDRQGTLVSQIEYDLEIDRGKAHELAEKIYEKYSEGGRKFNKGGDLETPGRGGYDEAIMESSEDKLANTIIDNTKVAKPFRAIGEGGSNIIIGDSVGESRKKKQVLAAAIFAPHKLFAMRKARDKARAEENAYAEGGALSKEFKFDKNFVIYVPSTSDVGNKISKKELNQRVKEVEKYVANEFGGYTETDTDGGYKATSGEIIEEDIVKVSVFANNKDWKDNEKKVVSKVKKWAKKWGQEAIGFEYEGDLYYIDDEGKFAKGGKVKKLYDTKEKKAKAVRKKGNIITFKEMFYPRGTANQGYTQIMVTGFQKQSGSVKIEGRAYDSKWYNSMDDLIKDVDWKKMEAWHSYSKGGKIHWSDINFGDSARVISENKMGVIVKTYGRKFHLNFPDGTEKTYDANDLEFYKFEKGGKVRAIGTCYDDSFMMALDEVGETNNNTIIYYGLVRDKYSRDKTEFLHSWVEKDGKVYDSRYPNPIEKEVYYDVNEIIKSKAYTPQEVIQNSLKKSKSGSLWGCSLEERNKIIDLTQKEYMPSKEAYEKVMKKPYAKGGSTKSNNTQVAETIIKQLGGIGKLKAFTGAYGFGTDGNNVTFRIKNRKVNAITITLNGKDLYDMKFFRVRGADLKLIKEYNDIYFDQLIPLFEENTGMYLSFKKGGLTPQKADQMLKDGTAQGKPLTDKQKRYFKAVSLTKTYKSGGYTKKGERFVKIAKNTKNKKELNGLFIYNPYYERWGWINDENLADGKLPYRVKISYSKNKPLGEGRLENINDLIIVDERSYAKGGKIGDTIRVSKTPYMVSFSELYDKDLTIKAIKETEFASGKRKEFVVEFKGKEYEVPQDMVENFEKGGYIKIGLDRDKASRFLRRSDYYGKYHEEEDELGGESGKFIFDKKSDGHDALYELQTEGINIIDTNLDEYATGGEVSLYFKQGASDKEYHIQIEEENGEYVVNFQYGRRGRALKSGTKTATPVSLPEAEKIYGKLLNSKLSKGYTPQVNTQQNFSQNIPTQKTVHKLPQLLNMVFTTREFINDDSYLAQEKMDGERRMVISEAGEVTGLNKKGQKVPLPSNIIDSVNNECIIDGEIIGDTLYAFDILSLDGEDLEGEPCIERISTLNTLRFGEGVRVVETAYTTEEKQEMFDKLEREHREGIVFKKKDSPYTHGRPSSGGNQLKFKFYKTATFIVANQTPGKRSVGLELIDDNGQKVFMGKVTIPPNKDIPNVGDLVEVRYLYAYKGGAVYQPTYIWKREDSDLTDAKLSQIIYKSEEYEKGGEIEYLENELIKTEKSIQEMINKGENPHSESLNKLRKRHIAVEKLIHKKSVS